MSLRTTSVNRKDYKTGVKTLPAGISYLYWKKYPASKKLNPTKALDVRIWLAGTSATTDWKIIAHHEPNTPGWPEGGYTVRSEKENLVSYVFYEEVIIHPKEKS